MRGGHQTDQIINYDAGIVLIDLHQLNIKNNFRQYKSATLNTGATSCQRRTEPAEQQPAASAFANDLNKLTSLLSKKGPGISQPGSLKPAVGD